MNKGTVKTYTFKTKYGKLTYAYYNPQVVSNQNYSVILDANIQNIVILQFKRGSGTFSVYIDDYFRVVGMTGNTFPENNDSQYADYVQHQIKEVFYEE